MGAHNDGKRVTFVGFDGGYWERKARREALELLSSLDDETQDQESREDKTERIALEEVFKCGPTIPMTEEMMAWLKDTE